MDLIHVSHDHPHPSTRSLGQGHSLRIFMLNFYDVSFCIAFDGFDSCWHEMT